MLKNKLAVLGFVSIALFFSCSESNENDKVESRSAQEIADERIDSLQKVLGVMYQGGSLETKTVLFLIQAYENYYQDFPKDVKSGSYMSKAGELYENVLKDKPKALKRYLTAYNEYQNYEHRPMALFRAANIYQDLGDTSKAISHFGLFIINHPKHDFADDAQNMIKITRMGMDEFIKQSMVNSEVEKVQ